MGEMGVELQPVSGMGNEAFWVDSPVRPPFGTLHVLQDTTYLHVGGDVRLEQAKPLVLRALERLR